MGYRRTGRPPGRPRHPGTFTPAEERVVEGIREGLSNAEITARLGVSPETVKTHVTIMLVRLDLADRHELAGWNPESRRTWWQPAVLLHAGAGRSWPWAVLLGSGNQILPEDCPEAVGETAPAGETGDFHQAVIAVKRRLVVEALDRSGGKITEAARALGLHPNYLHRLMRNLELRA